LANPGIGTFVVFQGGKNDRYFVLLHHFYRKFACDEPIDDAKKEIFAFYDVKERDCMVNVPMSLFNETASEGEVKMPKLALLMELDNAEKLQASKTPANEEEFDEVQLMALTPIPAEMMCIIIEKDGDPVQTFLAIRQLLQDKIREETRSIEDIKHYAFILQTVWAAATMLEAQEVLSTATLGITDDHLAIQVGQYKIMPIFPRDTHQQALPAPRQQSLSLEALSPFDEAGLIKKKGFKSLLLSTQQMILFAMMQKGSSEAPTKPLPDLKTLMDNTKEQAGPYMQQVLSKNKLNMVLDQKTAQYLRTAEILATDNEISKAFSIFMCGDKEMKQIKWGTNLQESDIRKQIETQSADSIKTKIKIPETYQDMLAHIENFQGLAKFIFGQKSEIVKCVYPWIDFCKQNKLSVQHQAHADAKIYAKILSIIDKRVQNFLRLCRDANDIEDINYKCLDCKNAIRVFEDEEISPAILPPMIEALFNVKGKGRDDQDDWQMKSPPNKKPRQAGNNYSLGIDLSTAKNENINEDFKNHYSNHFNKMMGSQQRASVPKCEGVSLCTRYHCSGFCKEGTSCPRAETHRKINKEKYQELVAW
jgi:hypothetical protein